MLKYQTLCCLALVSLLVGCQRQAESKEDLSAAKREFLQNVFSGALEEGPFEFQYHLKTVFLSKEVVSLFGTLNVYEHLPHAWSRYETKVFCNVDGRFQEVTLDDLFRTGQQKAFLRNAVETSLKANPHSYFWKEDPLYEYDFFNDRYIGAFIVSERDLILLFQPYTVGGLYDGPFEVRIPFADLASVWDVTPPLVTLLSQAISSGEYLASWDSVWEEYCLSRDRASSLMRTGPVAILPAL